MVIGSGAKVNATSRTKVTSIVTCDVVTVGTDTVVETMGGTADSVPLIDVREAVGAQQGDVNLWLMRRSGLRDRGKVRAWSNTRTLGGGIAVTMLMTPLSTIVASAMEGGPKRL